MAFGARKAAYAEFRSGKSLRKSASYTAAFGNAIFRRAISRRFVIEM